MYIHVAATVMYGTSQKYAIVTVVNELHHGTIACNHRYCSTCDTYQSFCNNLFGWCDCFKSFKSSFNNSMSS